MSRDFYIQSVNWFHAHADLLSVRHEVFVTEQGVPEEMEQDEHDPLSLHFLALDSDSRPIGTARLLPVGRVGRMAVRSDWRRQGVGRALLLAVIEAARMRGDCELCLRAQVHSIPFYESLGFSTFGDEFEEAGIPHREMRSRLS